jgi:hypothetical protein
MAKNLLCIIETLSEYSKDIQEGIAEEAINVAKKGMSKLKQTSPKSARSGRKGRYAKGWRVKTVKSFDSISCIIHNATDYQLTHLLENEHLTHNGGKYIPKEKHIQPVHDECVKEYEENVKKIIKRGGKL